MPAHDAALVKALAGALRSGGVEAERVRETLEPIVSSKKARTGAELVAFLRASPLASAGLTFERDRSAGRSTDIE